MVQTTVSKIVSACKVLTKAQKWNADGNVSIQKASQRRKVWKLQEKSERGKLRKGFFKARVCIYAFEILAHYIYFQLKINRRRKLNLIVPIRRYGHISWIPNKLPSRTHLFSNVLIVWLHPIQLPHFPPPPQQDDGMQCSWNVAHIMKMIITLLDL